MAFTYVAFFLTFPMEGCTSQWEEQNSQIVRARGYPSITILKTLNSASVQMKSTVI